MASTHWYLKVYGLRIRCHRRLLESFRQRRVRVNRPCNVFTACSVFDCQRRLRNHLTRVRPNDMNAQYPIGLLVTEELHQAVRLEIRLCSRVGCEWEGANIVLDALALELGLVLADPCYLRIGIHDGWNGAVVDVAEALCDVFDCRDAFVFGFVREHGPKGAVADDADVLNLSSVLLVDD